MERRNHPGAEWVRAISTMSTVVTFGAIVAALYLAQSIFIPVALAVLLTFILSPAVTWLHRRGTGRTLAVGIVMAMAIGTFVVVGSLVAHQLARLGETIPDYGPNIVAKVQVAKSWFGNTESNRFTQLVAEISNAVSPPPANAQPTVTIWGVPLKPPAEKEKAPEPQRVVVETAPSWTTRLQSVISPAVEFVGMVAFVNVLVIFMLLKKEDLRNRMIRLIGHGRVTMTTKAVDDATTRISRYLLTQLMLNGGFGLVMTLGLAIIGLPYPILWGFIAFVMRYVPYIGTWIGVIPPVLFSLAVSEGWSQPLAIFALFIGSEAICNNVFEPWLYGSSMGLSQVAQLIAAGFWAFLWGPIGLILSGPLTVCVLVLGKHVRRFEFFDILLGDEPALSPRVAFYQRLAARDQDEAAVIAIDEAKKRGPDVVLDEVLLPSLALAKRDHEDGGLSEHDWEEAVRAAREVGEEVAALDPKAPPEKETHDERIPLLLVPAKDEADLAAVDLLDRRIDPERWRTKTVAVGTLASEVIEQVQSFQPAAVVIASLPPGGASHMRYLVSRLRSRFPALKLLAARWGHSADLGHEQDRTGITGADWQHDTLQQSLRHLAEWAPVLKNSELAEIEPDRGRRSKVGTPAAPVS